MIGHIFHSAGGAFFFPFHTYNRIKKGDLLKCKEAHRWAMAHGW